VGNDPRPDRRFNTEKQAEIYDPQQTYQHLWLN
jgi:deoxyribodipyrimidine photo-lyase